MFKTIFWKQFMAFISTIVICLVVLGMGLSGLFKGYFIEQKKMILEEQSQRLANQLGRNAMVITRYTQDSIARQLGLMHEYMEVSLIITDENLNVITMTVDLENAKIEDLVGNAALAGVKEEETTSFQGRIKAISNDDILVVATPVTVGRDMRGAVFMIVSMLDLQENMAGVAQITFISTLIAGMVSAVLIYITSKTISKPIRQVSDAAKEIANGDFEKRLHVKSRDEVGQLAESFNDMAESLEHQEKLRRDFLANISHDLRSPLTSMRGFLQAIDDGTIPGEAQGKYIRIILEETDRLSKLANDILDINKLQNPADGLRMTLFDLNELIRKTVIMFETRITGKQMEMNVVFEREKTFVSADYEKIQRVVYNLVDNAVKFTESGGVISVETRTQDKKVFVKVRDNGIGIQPENVKRVFDRFFKADISRGEDKRGSGLGLAIVKEFVKAHDGTITVKSEPGQGCAFEFSLGLATEPD